MNFSKQIIDWYAINKRDLPWRASRDPYQIWVSEIILQQTKVAQGLSYYERFVQRFPSVKSLAEADEQEVLKLWQGLGYYSRARNMHAAAKQIMQKFGGEFPKTYSEIISLKGVGDYTAAAIASFVFALPHAVVDGNVYRLLARVFGIDTPINKGAGKKEFALLAQELLDEKQVAVYNQAIMEFGALQCVPRNQNCSDCVLQVICVAAQTNKVHLLPVKIKASAVRVRYFHYFVITKEQSVYLQKREANDIWLGLYEFPLIETDGDSSMSELIQLPAWAQTVEAEKFEVVQVSEWHKHVLSHQRIFARFYQLKIKDKLTDKKRLLIN